jgi:death-on-curing protein
LPERALRHLDVEAVLAIHEEVLAAHGGLSGLRDRALLESAVAAPQASFGGKPLIQDPIEMAAALVFLDANGLLPDPGAPTRGIDDWESLVLDVASSKLDREQTARRLRRLLTR